MSAARSVTVQVEIVTQKLEDGWGAAAVFDGVPRPDTIIYGASTRREAIEELGREIGDAIALQVVEQRGRVVR